VGQERTLDGEVVGGVQVRLISHISTMNELNKIVSAIIAGFSMRLICKTISTGEYIIVYKET
jgi:hypothetical protein